MTRNLNRSIQLIKSIHQALDENKFLQVNTALLLAFSGGQDSMALLSIFLQRKNQRRYRIGLCWCNHLWRCDSFYTMHHLMRLAFTLGEPIFFMVEPALRETNMVSRFARDLRWQARDTFGEARRKGGGLLAESRLSRSEVAPHLLRQLALHPRAGKGLFFLPFSRFSIHRKCRSLRLARFTKSFASRASEGTGKEPFLYGRGGTKLAISVVSANCHFSRVSDTTGWTYRQWSNRNRFF